MMMNRDETSDHLSRIICQFDVRQAAFGGYQTKIVCGSAESSVIDDIAYRWSYVEPAAALRENPSIYVRPVHAGRDGASTCVSVVGSDPDQVTAALWATHVLVAEDGRHTPAGFGIPVQLLSSRGVTIKPSSLTPHAMRRFVSILGVDAAIDLVAALGQSRGRQLGLVGPATGGTPIRFEERFWALRIALWLVNVKMWPTSWAVLGSTRYSFKADSPELVWYPDRPALQSGPCMIELGCPDAEQKRPGSLWLKILEEWFRSGDFMCIVRAARCLNRYSADPSDDNTARVLAEYGGRTDRTADALLKMADVAGSLGRVPGCAAKLKVRAARLALSGSSPDTDACRILDSLRQIPAIWAEPALIAGAPVAELLDAAFESGGQQPERVFVLLTTLPGQQVALCKWLGEHSDLLTHWLSSSADCVTARAIRRLGHRLFAYAEVCPSPVFQCLIDRRSGNYNLCSTAGLVLEFWDYPDCRRVAVEQGVCRALLGAEDLPADTWVSLSARFLVELASTGSFVEFENQIERSVARVAETPLQFEQWIETLITQTRTSGAAGSVMQAVRRAQLDLSLKDRISGSLWAAASLHPSVAAAWAEGLVMDNAAREDRDSSRVQWLEKAVRCHLQSGDAGALSQLLCRYELANDQELSGIFLSLLGQVEDSEQAVLWDVLSQARSFRCNVATLRQWVGRCRIEQRYDLLSLVSRVLAMPQAKLSIDDLAAYHQLERLVADQPNPAQGKRELALAFVCAATRLLEHFGLDDQPRSLMRSRARWIRLTEPGAWRRACSLIADLCSDVLTRLCRRSRALKPVADFSEQDLHCTGRINAEPCLNSFDDAADRD